MERLEARYRGYPVYNAGFPSFPRNFSRDSFVSGMLSGDANLLLNQLCLCTVKQGVTKNPYSGEEPGKVHHEYPGVKVHRGLSADFNACDTTALSLLAYEVYQNLTGDESLTKTHRAYIEQRVAYIASHIQDGRFVEDPEFCGAEHFALQVTYWKDSEILEREEGEPDYPVVYPLAHIMNMRAMRSAAKLLGREDLGKVADEMRRALPELYDLELGTFYIAVDDRGPIRGVSSDSLHVLFYLSPGDLPVDRIDQIVKASAVLETSLGYRVLDPKLVPLVEDQGHAATVWPFEQAIINSGAKKFGLDHVTEVSTRITPWLTKSDPELFFVKGDGTAQKSGCDPQLWTIAAKKYFLSGGRVILE